MQRYEWVITAVPLTCDLLYKCLKEEIACSYSSLSLTVFVLQRTNTCCRQTESQVRSQRALWVSKWSTSQITAWRGPAWSSTRSRRSPRCITSNTTTTSTSTCMIWWRPPRTDCQGSSSADGSSPTQPFVYLLKCYFSFPPVGGDVLKIETPGLLFQKASSSPFHFSIISHGELWFLNLIWP